jgi:hypothetical protein
MSSIASILDEGSDWLAELPAYQQNLIAKLQVNRGLEETARAWLEAGPGPQTVGFSAIDGARIFYEKVLDQLHEFLCDSNKYVEERANLLQEYKAGQTSFVAGVTTFIAPHVGTSPTLLAPAIAVILTVISQASLRAWCEMQSERRDRSDSDDGKASP